MEHHKFIRSNKTDLIKILCTDIRFILQHVEKKGLITRRDYKNLIANSDVEREKATIDLLDMLIDKGDQQCKDFISLLGEAEPLETFPKLEKILSPPTPPQQAAVCTPATVERTPSPPSESDSAEQDEPGHGPPHQGTLCLEGMTVAKLEEYASVPENAEQLKEELKRKLGDGEMAKIQHELRKYDILKKTLCFSTKDILLINKNQALKKLGKDTGTEKINAKSVEPFIKHLFDKSRLGNKPKAPPNNNIRQSPALGNIEEDNSEQGGQSVVNPIRENRDESDQGKEQSNNDGTQLLALNHSDNIKQDNTEQGEGEKSGQSIKHNTCMKKNDETYDKEPLSDITNMLSCSTNRGDSEGEINDISEGESTFVHGLKRPGDNQHSGFEPPPKVSKRANPQPARRVSSGPVFKGAIQKYADDKGIPSQELKTWIKVINVKQHEKYPFLVADRCVILQPPPEARDQWPEAKLILADEKMLKTTKTGKQLTPDAKVKIQYEMGILGITETIVLFPDNPDNKPTYVLCQYDQGKRNETPGMYNETVGRCKDFVCKLLAPLIVIFKQNQREEIMSTF